MTTVSAGVQTTWGEAWGDLHDIIAGMTGYSIVDTSGDLPDTNGFDRNGQWWVAELPSGENLRFSTSRETVVCEYGPTWDSTNDTWESEYPNDPATTFSSSTRQLTPINDDYPGFEYSVQYNVVFDATSGFAFHMTGIGSSTDGNTTSAVGLAELSKLFEYPTGEEAAFAMLYLQGWQNPTVFNLMCGGGDFSGGNGQDYGGRGVESDGTMVSNARVNGAANSAVVPVARPNITSSELYGNTLCGRHDLWLWAQEGFANGDIIEDSGGKARYQVFESTGTEDIGFKL